MYLKAPVSSDCLLIVCPQTCTSSKGKECAPVVQYSSATGGPPLPLAPAAHMEVYDSCRMPPCDTACQTLLATSMDAIEVKKRGFKICFTDV